MADGGGEFTVVSVVDLVLEFEVDSVTMAWAMAAETPNIKAQLVIIFIIHFELLGITPAIFTGFSRIQI
jgi:hypothetical protein